MAEELYQSVSCIALRSEAAMSDRARIDLNVFNGKRLPFASGAQLLVTIRDGNQTLIHRDSHPGPHLVFELPFFNNFGDLYSVIAFADKQVQAGFFPVKVSPLATQSIDLMLLPKKNKYDFSAASWNKLKTTHKKLTDILGNSAANASEAAARYEERLDTDEIPLAAFFNIATATRDVILPRGSALDYFKEMIWDGKFGMKKDRFFAYADALLVDQVVQAVSQGAFDQQAGVDVFHPGATRSFKQKQLGEANVQLSFHENDQKKIDGIDCVKVEMDMDYFKDPLAHTILEVIPNSLSGGKTDPRTVYVLRWIAGRRARVPEFDPPYTIVPA